MTKYKNLSFLTFASLLSAMSLLIYGFLPAQTGWAANSSLSLSPTPQTVSQGSDVIITVKVNTGGDSVNAVQANLTYPSNIFDSATISSTPAFGVEAESIASNGTIKIARGASTPVNGVVDVAVITFRAANAGTAVVDFSPGSMIVRSTDNTNILTITNSATVTVSSPTPTPPPPTPTPTPPPPTPTPTPPPPTHCKSGDINCDGKINALDLGTVLGNYGKTTNVGDSNGDGKVNALDLGAVLAAYGK